MSKQTRYLLTVDSETGAAVKLERLGEAGDLTEVPLSTLAVAPMAAQGQQPLAGAVPPPSPQSLVINIYMGGPQQAAPLSLALPGPTPQPGATPSLSTVGPGGPGGLSLFSLAEARKSSTSLQAPEGPGGLTSLSVEGPGGPGSPPPGGPGGPGNPGGPDGPGGGGGGSR